MSALPLPVLVDALTALRAVKDAPSDTVPAHLWRQCMRAANQLEYRLLGLGLTVDVEAPEGQTS